MTMIKSHIEDVLKNELQPTFLEVVDESWQHGSGPDAQSHYKVIIVSEQFQGLKLLARHRIVQGFLADVIARIRALSLHTMTKDEWEKSCQNQGNFRSPGCHNKNQI